jgi:hypothetical protein
MSGILVSGDLALWNESGPSDSLFIENNTFENCAFGGNRGQSIISIDPEYGNNADIRETYSSNILIRNNQIKTFDSPILVASSVDGIVFERNVIEQTDRYLHLFPNEPNLKIVNCKRVVISGNSYRSLSGKTGTLSIDKNTTNITVENNQSFNRIK